MFGKLCDTLAPGVQTLHALITSSDGRVASNAITLLADLLILTPTRSTETQPTMRTSANLDMFGDLRNQQIHRPLLPLNTPHQLLPETDIVWTELRLLVNEVSSRLLDSPEVAVRQGSLLVLGNALYRFFSASSVALCVLDKIEAILLEDASARLRTNAAGVLGNLALHVASTTIDTGMTNKILSSLLETGCLDGDRRVQEASLHSLCLWNSMYEHTREILLELGATAKLRNLQRSMTSAGVSRFGRKVLPSRPQSRPKSSSLVTNDIIASYASALCETLQ
ncbi:unnamed protein product [Dicrocoelium dendriticum]|nr:unnamed protein product [Dicrocoelium dendriticum]